MRRFIILFVLLLAACGTPATVAPPTSLPPTASADTSSADPCGEETLNAYRNTYTTIISRWGSAAISAGNKPAAELPAVIEQLQAIAGDLSGLEPPACAKQAHGESLQAMQMAITGYQNLVANKDAGAMIRDSIDQLADARLRIAALPDQPAPTPTAEATATIQATFTPLPTVTPTSTPEPTATPLPRKGVIGSSRAQVFETPTSNTPIKTLLKDTTILVFEVQKGRLHIRAGSLEGWVSQSSVIIK